MLVDLKDFELHTSLTPSLYTITRLGRALLVALNACNLSTIISERSLIIYEREVMYVSRAKVSCYPPPDRSTHAVTGD